MKKFLLYIFRWQCSTPILYVVILILPYGSLIKSIIANIIGGCIFYWIDRLIFDSNKRREFKNKCQSIIYTLILKKRKKQ